MTTITEPLILLDIRGILIRRYSVTNNADGLELAKGGRTALWQRALAEVMMNDILPLLENVAPRQLIAVWDKGNDYRCSMFPDYKRARRERAKEADPIITEQIQTLQERFKQLSAYLGIKHVSVAEQEADDVIAMFCEKLQHRPLTVITVDGDLVQLAGQYGNVTVIRGGEFFFIDVSAGHDNMHLKGVPLEFIRLHKSVVGDTSDGFPGVSGMGPIAWDSMVRNYDWDGMGELENCVRTEDYAALDAALTATKDPNLGKLLANKSQWRLSYQLAGLHPEVCYGFSGDTVIKPEWYVRLPLAKKFYDLLQEAECPDLIKSFDPFLIRTELLDSEKHLLLRQVCEEVAASPIVGYDFESHDKLKNPNFKKAAKGKKFVDVLSQVVDGISFCIGPNLNRAYYVPINHRDTFNLSTEWAKYVVQCCSVSPIPVVQNASFELTLSINDLKLAPTPPYDTQIMASYVDENEEPHLKDMAMRVFRYKQATYEEVTQGRSMDELSGDEVVSYGCDDSIVSCHLFDLFRLIMELEGTWDFYRQNEIEPAIDDARTFITGTKIDLDFLAKCATEDVIALKKLVREIRILLETNCMTKEQERHIADATNLLNIWWELKEKQFSVEANFNTPEGQEKARSEYEKLWAKAWAAAVYAPYTEEIEEVKFSPTALQLTQIMQFLGFSEKEFEKNTKDYIGVWLHTHGEDLRASDNPLAGEFIATLGPAAGNLAQVKKRTGDEYEEFQEVCLRILAEAKGEDRKIIKHGDELNFNSPPQMTELLYGKMGLLVRRRGKMVKGSTRDRLGLKAAPVTGNKAIATALVNDVAEKDDWRRDALSIYMGITRILQNQSLYYEPYPLWVHPVDGKIHPQIRNCRAVTRRPSGNSPNVLQVSKKEDAKIRRAYIPHTEEAAYVCLDFSGQELRLTASESKDPVMLDAYLGDIKKDLHSLTGAAISKFLLPRKGFSEYGSDIDYDKFIALRKGEDEKLAKACNSIRSDFAKAVNFLIIYVGQATTLSENLIIAKSLAEQIMNSTFNLYKRLKPWQQEVIEFARLHGYVETAYGNRRHLTKDLLSTDGYLRSRQERQAVNYTIQGCAADILKVVRQEMHRRNTILRHGANSVMPIYDEVAASVPLSVIPDYIMEMKEIMEVTPPGHAVPMEIEAGIGLKSWGAKQELSMELTHENITEWLREQKEGNHV